MSKEHRIDNILDRRTVKGEAQVLVKWTDLDDDQNSWVPEEHITKGLDKLLKEFEAPRRRATRAAARRRRSLGAGLREVSDASDEEEEESEEEEEEHVPTPPRKLRRSARLTPRKRASPPSRTRKTPRRTPKKTPDAGVTRRVTRSSARKQKQLEEASSSDEQVSATPRTTRRKHHELVAKSPAPARSADTEPETEESAAEEPTRAVEYNPAPAGALPATAAGSSNAISCSTLALVGGLSLAVYLVTYLTAAIALSPAIAAKVGSVLADANIDLPLAKIQELGNHRMELIAMLVMQLILGPGLLHLAYNKDKDGKPIDYPAGMNLCSLLVNISTSLTTYSFCQVDRYLQPDCMDVIFTMFFAASVAELVISLMHAPKTSGVGLALAAAKVICGAALVYQFAPVPPTLAKNMFFALELLTVFHLLDDLSIICFVQGCEKSAVLLSALALATIFGGFGFLAYYFYVQAGNALGCHDIDTLIFVIVFATGTILEGKRVLASASA